MIAMTRSELRRRIEAALVWTEGVDRACVAARLLGLSLLVDYCDLRQCCAWYIFGTGANLSPRGQAATVDEAKGRCIDAAVEHFVNVLSFVGVETVAEEE